MADLTVNVETEINPTESEERVKQAVESMFGPMDTQVKPLHQGALLTAKATGQEALTKFHHLLQRERIRSAARTVFLSGLERKSINFCLNKQVAFAGHVSFSREVAESPLGPIRVKIECDNPREVVTWLTRMT